MIKKIGYGLIKNVEIEIGGQIIDKQYGEWFNIWYELCESNTKNSYRPPPPINSGQIRPSMSRNKDIDKHPNTTDSPLANISLTPKILYKYATKY